MPATLVLPEGIAYTGAALVSVLWVTTWQMVKVGGARKKAGIPYPQLYAENAQAAASKEAQIFNCTQRAHQNTLENLPMVLTATAIMSTKYPVVAASLLGAWTFSRVLYTIGYSTGDPAKRNFLGSSMGSALTAFGLLIGSTWTVFEHIKN